MLILLPHSFLHLQAAIKVIFLWPEESLSFSNAICYYEFSQFLSIRKYPYFTFNFEGYFMGYRILGENYFL